MTEVTIDNLARQCALERANSADPMAVMVKWFRALYDAGIQVGIRQAAESLDAKDWSETREKS